MLAYKNTHVFLPEAGNNIAEQRKQMKIRFMDLSSVDNK